MEFEAEEEMQIRNTQLTSGSQGLPPAAPLKLDPSGLPAPDLNQQPGKTTAFQQEPGARGPKGGVHRAVVDREGVGWPCFCHCPSRGGTDVLNGAYVHRRLASRVPFVPNCNLGQVNQLL